MRPFSFFWSSGRDLGKVTFHQFFPNLDPDSTFLVEGGFQLVDLG